MYLKGHGFQKSGPQNSNALFLNTAITNIGLSKNLRLNLFPSIFFIRMDSYRGNYLTVTSVLAHKKLPFSISSTINQTIKTELPGNKNFMWNVGLNYNFRKTLIRLN